MENFGFSDMILQHEVEWGKEKERYKEVVCVALDKSVSFVVYWYVEEEDKLYLRNLYVSDDRRGKGIGTLIVCRLALYCETNKKELRVRVGDDILKWYEKFGFKIDYKLNGLEKDVGVVWMSYKKET